MVVDTENYDTSGATYPRQPQYPKQPQYHPPGYHNAVRPSAGISYNWFVPLAKISSDISNLQKRKRVIVVVPRYTNLNVIVTCAVLLTVVMIWSLRNMFERHGSFQLYLLICEKGALVFLQRRCYGCRSVTSILKVNAPGYQRSNKGEGRAINKNSERRKKNH